ncbi:TetR/AcrR family transcriptional regulator [Deinococcus koreensis]|uniref:TetR family transcriptional regulator n=1 Tax=Deinococcus koreensis TaxID=2054903 RepID=A0A2K3V1I5_9DEIO|nr:TetR/AcrR family transcriptional regulator [Deinococcus koreensis]PNY82631.1 TetR family transcriptional regulator [Deinococcus koreensis]
MPYPTKLTPDAILDAAWALLGNGGPEALSMRPLADALGVRPGSLYRHIESRDALIRTLAERSALALQAELLAAASGHPSRDALQAASLAYLHYARSQPHAYGLLLNPDHQTGQAGIQTPPGKALWNTLLALVGALSGDPDDTNHAVALWTFLHGASALERAGIYGASGPRGGLDVGLVALLDHMEAAAQQTARNRPS